VNGRLASAARLLLTTVAAAAWLAISNHCVIAAGTAPQKDDETAAAHASCPGHPAPANPADEKKPILIECCKTLTTTPASFDRYQIGYQPGDFVPFRFQSSRLCCAPMERPALILPLDTGPPGAGSFAEIVLQRSLLAHAPPRLA
jgi:hypothetical protein